MHLRFKITSAVALLTLLLNAQAQNDPSPTFKLTVGHYVASADALTQDMWRLVAGTRF